MRNGFIVERAFDRKSGLSRSNEFCPQMPCGYGIGTLHFDSMDGMRVFTSTNEQSLTQRFGTENESKVKHDN